MFWFQLWREYKLSIAELLAVFPEGTVVFCDASVLILSWITEDKILKKAPTLWGTIKIFSIWLEFSSFDARNIATYILGEAEKTEWKFQYGVSLLSGKQPLNTLLKTIKKQLQEHGISSRFVNKDFKNLSSAQIIGEKLVQKWTDFSIITSPHLAKEGARGWCWKTIWVQDIEAYTKRDYGKSRDMQIGMLPPKLAQMMINLSSAWYDKCHPELDSGSLKWLSIYDPFVGLGTVLIEAVSMGYASVYGSDVNDRMVEVATQNLASILGRDQMKWNIFKLNAKFIEEATCLQEKKVSAIVTEGYLGEVMTKQNISLDRIEKQQKSLEKIYEWFFHGLQKLQFPGTVVISFPFWELQGKYIYCSSLYDILERYCEVCDVLPVEMSSWTWFRISSTKIGSLLYKRSEQRVGREIFKLKIK